VFWRSKGRDRTIADYGEAWQALVMFALACLYCVINLGAWDKIRDWTDIVDKGNWGTFSVYAVAVWAVCLGVLPLAWYLLNRTGMAMSRMNAGAKSQFLAGTASLIPMGLGCWIAFALATVLSMMTFVLQSLSDPFNWGWNLLGMAGSRWHIIASPAIPWIEVACVLVGAGYAMETLYRAWLDGTADRRRALVGGIPQGLFLWASAGAMICFFAG
jgi:hypothetical protein